MKGLVTKRLRRYKTENRKKREKWTDHQNSWIVVIMRLLWRNYVTMQASAEFAVVFGSETSNVSYDIRRPAAPFFQLINY